MSEVEQAGDGSRTQVSGTMCHLQACGPLGFLREGFHHVKIPAGWGRGVCPNFKEFVEVATLARAGVFLLLPH